MAERMSTLLRRDIVVFVRRGVASIALVEENPPSVEDVGDGGLITGRKRACPVKQNNRKRQCGLLIAIA